MTKVITEKHPFMQKVEQLYQKMEELEFEYHAHRQCEHEWGDVDNDGDEECIKCGLFKDKNL